ncbi:MAG: VWA domain-containing protein [Rhodomicrobium sp.]
MGREGGVIAPDRDAVSQLTNYIRQREVLCIPFRKALTSLSGAASNEELQDWSQAVLGLADVNAGPATLLAFWQLTVDSVEAIGAEALSKTARVCAQICRHAGASGTREVLHACLALRPLFEPLSQGHSCPWWRAWLRLAREAPQCVTALAANAVKIAAAGGSEGFENFVAAGLRSAASAQLRLVFFTLEDPSAQLVLDRLAGGLSFSDLRQRMRSFASALWGTSPPIRPADSRRTGSERMRRSTITEGVVCIPEVFPGVPSEQAGTLFSATVAHATAHLALGKGRFPIGSLKPLQIVLVGLIEDARIETIAMQRFPGLRRLWAPFHVATASGISTAPALLARLSRALLDPSYEDNDEFVEKGRTLFQGIDDIKNPNNSRRIGGLLGNDLGQMRLQFNAKTYAVEPMYRDDGLGLWEFPPETQMRQPDECIEVEAARAQADQTHGAKDENPESGNEETGRARGKSSNQGVAVATYPEWDHAAQTERSAWTTVREVPSPSGDAGRIENAIDQQRNLRSRIERFIRGAKVGRLERLRGQPSGSDFDLDAMIDVAIDMRVGQFPIDDRIFRVNAPQRSGPAVSVLIDVSESTRDPAPVAGTTIVEVEKLAVAVLASAVETAGDAFALYAFSSEGRHNVRFVRVKDFAQQFDRAAKARLAGLQPGLSTRLGAALRHTGAELAPLKALRKIMLVLTDGSPSDIDVADSRDLIEDARRAVLALRANGVDVFGIVLDPAGLGAGSLIFGRTNTIPIHRIEELPNGLSQLYFRLTRR